MNLDDTIVAIATPPGRGGIGVVRLAGPEARALAEPMVRLRHALEPGRAIFGELIDPDESGGTGASPVQCGADTQAREHTWGAGAPSRESAGTAKGVGAIRANAPHEPGATDSAARERAPAPHGKRMDEVVVTYFQKPHSYTTDDIVEISAHGSPVVLRHIVELALARGARLAEPGEFTMRAFLNGRMDLTQAEAVRDLIQAQTLFQAKVAAQQLEGALSKRLQPIKQKLIELIALLEAGIDFAEDDVSVAPDVTILERVAAVHQPLEELAASFAYGKLVHEGLTLAIVGRPNVGKSSLFNRLVERERAIVTAQPGTTRDLVSETVAIEGIPVRLVDTAGIRHALDEAESIGVRKSIEAMADADLVLIVLDATQPRTNEDKQLLAQIKDRPAIVVANKSDLIVPSSPQLILGAAAPSPGEAVAESKDPYPHPNIGANSEQHTAGSALATSALTGEGIAELRAAILWHVGGELTTQMEAGFLTNVRHQKLVSDSLAALDGATRAVGARVPHEMLLLDLYGALRPLDEITGATTTDDILNLIFGTFCIGK